MLMLLNHLFLGLVLYPCSFPLDIINFNSYYDLLTSIAMGRGSWHLVSYCCMLADIKLDTCDLICCFSLLGEMKVC